MPSINTMTTGVCAAFMLLGGVIAGSLVFENDLEYNVTCHAAHDGEVSPDKEVTPGDFYKTTDKWEAKLNKGGVALKCWPSDLSFEDNHYQLAVTVDDRGTWYQLSKENGNPFYGEDFEMGIPEFPDCDWERCPAYADCEAPTHVCDGCEEDVVLYMGQYH